MFQVVLIALVCLWIFQEYKWSFGEYLLLGAIASATDPVAVVALLRDLGCSAKVSTIIEGESLLNDGTAIVLFKVLYKIVILGEASDPARILGLFFWNGVCCVYS